MFKHLLNLKLIFNHFEFHRLLNRMERGLSLYKKESLGEDRKLSVKATTYNKSGSRGAEKRRSYSCYLFSFPTCQHKKAHLYLHPITTGKRTYRNPPLKEYKAKQKMINSEDCFWSYVYPLICSALMKGNELLDLARIQHLQQTSIFLSYMYV